MHFKEFWKSFGDGTVSYTKAYVRLVKSKWPLLDCVREIEDKTKMAKEKKAAAKNTRKNTRHSFGSRIYAYIKK